MKEQKLKILYELLNNYEISNIEQVEEIYHLEKIHSNMYYNKRFFIIIAVYVTIYLFRIFLEKAGLIFPIMLYKIIQFCCAFSFMWYLMHRIIGNYQRWTSLFISATNSICFRNNLNGFNSFTADEKDVSNLLREIKKGEAFSKQDKILAEDLIEFYHVRKKFINFI